MIQMMLQERHLKRHLFMMKITGNYQRADSLKPTVYDPNDVARTTIKEIIHHKSNWTL